MPSDLLAEQSGSTLILSLGDSATRSTLSEPLIAAGIAALATAEADGRLRCVVVLGANGHFCAGGNLQLRLGLSPNDGANAALVRALQSARVACRAGVRTRIGDSGVGELRHGQLLVEQVAGTMPAEQLSAERDHFNFIANLFHRLRGPGGVHSKRPPSCQQASIT